MGLDQKFWVGSNFGCLGRVRSAIFWFGFGKFPLKIPNFGIFSLRVKKNLIRLGQKVPGSRPGWTSIYCRSKVCSGKVKAHLQSKVTRAWFFIQIHDARIPSWIPWSANLVRTTLLIYYENQMADSYCCVSNNPPLHVNSDNHQFHIPTCNPRESKKRLHKI